MREGVQATCVGMLVVDGTLLGCRYVVSAHPRSVEVMNTITLTSAQSIPLPGAMDVVRFYPCPSNIGGSGSGSGSGAGVGVGVGAGAGQGRGGVDDTEHVLVVCPRNVFVLRMVPLVMQVAALVSCRPAQFEEALALCEYSSNYGGGVRCLSAMRACASFHAARRWFSDS